MHFGEPLHLQYSQWLRSVHQGCESSKSVSVSSFGVHARQKLQLRHLHWACVRSGVCVCVCGLVEREVYRGEREGAVGGTYAVLRHRAPLLAGLVVQVVGLLRVARLAQGARAALAKRAVVGIAAPVLALRH